MTDAEFIDAQTLVSRWDHRVVQPELQHSLGIRSEVGCLGPNLCCVSLLALFFSLIFFLDSSPFKSHGPEHSSQALPLSSST